jgi:uncharacterized cupredoxin-like copper-binding protein
MSSMSNRLAFVRQTRRRARLIVLAAAAAGAAVGAVSAEPAPARVVKAELNEWKVSLANDTVSAGAVTLQVHNAGTMPHVFEVEGNGMEKRTRPIPPDSTAVLTVTLKPGKYEIYCPLAGGKHKKMGMETDLAVRAEH